MRFAPSLLSLGLVSLALFSCSSTPTTATTVVRPQLVAVDPDDFLGTLVHCIAPTPEGEGSGGAGAGEPDANAANAVHSYVATLFDVTPDADGGVPYPGTPLASSPPTPCTQPVTFSYVVAGHRYVAEVDAYQKRPQDLTPISEGSRLLFNSDGTRALPGWAATCGGYPPSPYAEAGTESGGGAGTGEADAGAAGGRPPGVVSYASITQTPHDCGAGLVPPPAN